MLEWLNQIDWPGILSKAQVVAELNFTTALIGSLAGAFGGAWAAQRIAEKSKLREDLLKEIRHTNAASSMVYGIANAHLGLKSQHIQALQDNYLEEMARFELFEKARAAGTVPPRQIFNVNADLQTLKPLYSPVDQIQRLMFDQISITGAALFVLPILLATMQSLNESLEDRNRLVEEWKANKPKNLVQLYLGLPDENVVDQRYKMLVEAIYRQTDDVIAFSTMIGDALYDHAIAQRKKLRERFKIEGPVVTKIDFSRFSKFIPPAKEYENFAKMFELKKATPAKGSS